MNNLEETGCPEFWTKCEFCGVEIRVRESRVLADGWLEIRRRLGIHLRGDHRLASWRSYLNQWDTEGDWESAEAPVTQAVVERVRAEIQQRQEEQDAAQADEELEQEEADCVGEISREVRRMLDSHSRSIFS